MLTTAKMTIIPVLISILSAVDITSNSFTAEYIAKYYNSNKPIDMRRIGEIMQIWPDSILCKKRNPANIMKNLQDRAPNASWARLKFDT